MQLVSHFFRSAGTFSPKCGVYDASGNQLLFTQTAGATEAGEAMLVPCA